MDNKLFKSILKEIIEFSFGIQILTDKGKISFDDPFYRSNKHWIKDGELFLGFEKNGELIGDRNNVLNISSELKKQLQNQLYLTDAFLKQYFFEFGLKKVTSRNKIYLVLTTNTNNRILLDTFLKMVTDYKEKLNTKLEKEIKDNKYYIRISTNKVTFVNVVRYGKLETVILNSEELSFLKAVIKIFKGSKKNKIDSFITLLKLENISNRVVSRDSIDNGWGSYTYFYNNCNFDLTGNVNSDINFQKIFYIVAMLWKKYKISSSLNFNNFPRSGWSIYTTSGGYTHVSG
jgi:hypothetical protein